MTRDDIKVGSIIKMCDKYGTIEYEVIGVKENLYSFEITLKSVRLHIQPKTIFWPKLIDGYKMEYADGQTYELIKNE